MRVSLEQTEVPIGLLREDCFRFPSGGVFSTTRSVKSGLCINKYKHFAKLTSEVMK